MPLTWDFICRQTDRIKKNVYTFYSFLGCLCLAGLCGAHMTFQCPLGHVEKVEVRAQVYSEMLSAAELKKGYLIPFEGSSRPLIWALQFPLKHANDLTESHA